MKGQHCRVHISEVEISAASVSVQWDSPASHKGGCTKTEKCISWTVLRQGKTCYLVNMECMNHLLWLRVGRGACIASGSTYNAISITPSYEEGGNSLGEGRCSHMRGWENYLPRPQRRMVMTTQAFYNDEALFVLIIIMIIMMTNCGGWWWKRWWPPCWSKISTGVMCGWSGLWRLPATSADRVAKKSAKKFFLLISRPVVKSYISLSKRHIPI